jgi:beta-glucosidase
MPYVYDIPCQRYFTMDIKTVRLGRGRPLESGPASRAGYCIRARKLLAPPFLILRRLSQGIAGNAAVFTAVAILASSSPVHASGPAVHPELWPAVRPALASDPAVESRLDAILAGMTLEQKVGQLIQPDIASIAPDDLRHFALGSILNGGNSSPNGDEFAQPSEWLALADRFYDASMDPSHGPHPIPTIWGTDAVHGHNNIIGATIFPHNVGLGATRDPKLLRKIGEITALEVRATGLDWSFGPTLAVVQDIRWGRSYESYSEDPQVVREYASAMLLGLQGTPGTPEFLDASHVIASPKHFVGDGGTGGKDQGDNLSSEAELRAVHAVGYPVAIGAGAQTVMASFSSWQGIKMLANRELLTDVLKGRWSFDGFVVGDWNAHAQVPGCTKFDCAVAINAGLDMFMAPDSWRELYANTLAEARSGAISKARLDDAVRRILRVKLRARLFDEGRPSSRPLAGHFELLGAPEHRAVARQAVRESLVLLKNEHHILPLSPKSHVLVAGDGADNIGKQCGGWTITWQGTGVANKDFPHGESIYAGIREAVAAGGGTSELNAAGDYKTRPDVAVVVFGENQYAEFQGDLQTVEYSPGDKPDLRLLRKLRAQHIPVVAVFISGRPLWANAEINAADAFVAAWLPGTEGGGIADVLFKKPDGSVQYDFHGRLSFAWPRTPAQWLASLPGERAARELPLFPVGYGLHYRDNGDLKPLPEDAGAVNVLTVDNRTFFSAGKAGLGWHWAASAQGDSVRELPHGVGSLKDNLVTLAAADKAAQEDARLIHWSGAGPAWVGLTGNAPIDLQREANGQLSLGLDYKVDSPIAGGVDLRLDCGTGCGGAVPIARVLAAAPAGHWAHLKIPLVCFAKAGADLAHVTTPFAVQTKGSLALSVANIHLETGLDGVMSCDDASAAR